MTLVHDRVAVRELVARNHLIQLLARADTFGFVTSIRLSGGQVGFTYHQTQSLAVVAYRRIYVAYRGPTHRAKHRGTEHRLGGHRSIQFSAHPLLNNVANDVIGYKAHHRGWTTLLGDDVFALAILQNEQ